MIRRVIRILATGALVLAALAIVLYLALFAINWADQAPSAAALELSTIHASRPPVPESANGYVYFMGFGAPRDSDPHTFGTKRIEWAKGAIQRPGTDILEPPEKDLDVTTGRSATVKSLSEACKVADAGCRNALLEGGSAIREWLSTEEWLLARYQKLLTYTGWFETVTYDVRLPMPLYTNALEGQKLLLLQVWHLAGKGDHEGVKNLLAADIRFWRNVQASTDTLITKMIALAALRRHFGLANLALKRLPQGLSDRSVPEEWRRPISDSERSMLRCFAGEWLFTQQLLAQAETSTEAEDGDGLPDVTKPFYKKQATVNLHAKHLIEVATELAVPYERLPEARRENSDREVDWFRVYNPAGAMVAAIGISSFMDYGIRVADLEGMRRAALVTVELREAGVPLDGVAVALDGSRLQNPYTGSPFEWDQKESAIVFRGLLEGNRYRYAYLY